MGIQKSLFLTLVLGALAMITTSCETRDAHAKASPPPQAAAPTLTAATPVPPPQVEEKPTPNPDPVDGMVAAAEKEYQEGQANYAAGHLDAAKQNFDRAFNDLTQGPMDIKSDARLQQEFDKIVEGTSKLELQALKQGDGFTEQKSVSAPIDEANEVTFPVDPKIKAAAEAELKATHFDLPLTLNDYVAGYINFYTNSPKGHATVERALTRAGRYREMIQRVLREEGVPQDLIYLAQAESGFHPLALSRAGARGMWQFIASRASGYDLTRNWWVDERQDPVAHLVGEGNGEGRLDARRAAGDHRDGAGRRDRGHRRVAQRPLLLVMRASRHQQPGADTANASDQWNSQRRRWLHASSRSCGLDEQLRAERLACEQLLEESCSTEQLR